MAKFHYQSFREIQSQLVQCNAASHHSGDEKFHKLKAMFKKKFWGETF